MRKERRKDPEALQELLQLKVILFFELQEKNLQKKEEEEMKIPERKQKIEKEKRKETRVEKETDIPKGTEYHQIWNN